MTETLYLIVGAVLLGLVIYDFFFTTLSGNGAAFITRIISALTYRVLQFCVKIVGRRIYSLSGMVVNLMVLLVWVTSVWLGLYLLFSSNPDAIVNSSGRSATPVERLYYAGYTLSTLGVGNFKPQTTFFELLTSCFSFYGFIFFTASMTYLLSISSAVINKRSLALTIRSLGRTPYEIEANMLKMDRSYCYQQFKFLQEQIVRHSVNHQAYPVLHFYSNATIDGALSINLARLDEALSILLNTGKGEKLHNELKPLRTSLTDLLDHIESKYSHTLSAQKHLNMNPVPDQIYIKAVDEDPEIDHRRKIINGLLWNESFKWQDVYSGR